ncbi:MAG: serine protease [Bacteroidetes bacterium GWE2_29_8]|nr:MAG: serine protease [Bacteroidetes bacterium GWE2_29_8]OFY15393.1 MAG: serine protease [Bacteroidetes bacterium GWF2_29_10]
MIKIKGYLRVGIVFLFSIALSINYIYSQSIGEKINEGKKIKVYVCEIKKEIALPVLRITQKAFAEALKIKADLIIIDMNTYGGALDAADSIRTIILNSPIPVFVFVNNNAASAGALISLACDSIYMKTGANIGAATVVNQSGEPMPDKYQSYMRSMMRSTAEAKGRNPIIAQAMVTASMKGIDGVVDSGKVLTFTVSEAIKNNFCEGKAESIEDILAMNNIKNPEIIIQKLSAIDNVIGFLINPMFSGILIMIIIGGIYYELQSPGIGFPLMASITAAVLYFAPLYLEGLAENWEIAFFIVGVILLFVEILVIPGFGVAGVLGITFVIGGLTLSLINNIGFDFKAVDSNLVVKSLFIVVVSILMSIVLSIYFTGRFINTRMFNKLVLNYTEDSNMGYSIIEEEFKMLHDKLGVAISDLRPSGKIEIEGEQYDAIAQVGYVNKGEQIKVVGYQTASIVVRKA